ncbi:phosphoribosylglycinamide formyltransferase [Aliivibrio kagoshimensis]|jgi:hypothetical protein|uniref:phosphoribosylglycinamide formyltransferase n=1 Tax=Aliivibrio kagoshimensis TaxID=2910230 RepID=UPI003D0E8CE5
MNRLLRAAVLMVLVFGRGPVQASPLQEIKDAENRDTERTETSKKDFQHSLSGLYGVENLLSSVEQPYQDFDVLYSKAHQAQFELESLCNYTALLSHTQPHFSGIKSEQRAKIKIATELNGQVNKITDLARATIVANNVNDLMVAYENLNRESTIVKVKNRFKTPGESGYRDLNLLVKLPKTGLIAEVQLHLADIAEVKSGPEHAIYEKIQKVERLVAVEQRAFSPFELAQIESLRKQSQAMYQQAWQTYLTPNSSAA